VTLLSSESCTFKLVVVLKQSTVDENSISENQKQAPLQLGDSDDDGCDPRDSQRPVKFESDNDELTNNRRNHISYCKRHIRAILIQIQTQERKREILKDFQV